MSSAVEIIDSGKEAIIAASSNENAKDLTTELLFAAPLMIALAVIGIAIWKFGSKLTNGNGNGRHWATKEDVERSENRCKQNNKESEDRLREEVVKSEERVKEDIHRLEELISKNQESTANEFKELKEHFGGRLGSLEAGMKTILSIIGEKK